MVFTNNQHRRLPRPNVVAICLSLLWSTLLAQAVLVNFTIDDTSDKLSYSAGWNPIDEQHPCGGCTVTLTHYDKVYETTYHDTTANRKGEAPVSTVSLSFYGNAIYAFVIIPGNDHPGIVRLDAEYYFFLNGSDAGTYQHKAPTVGDDGYIYNSTVYANETLDMGLHNFTIQAGRQGGQEALMLLDYLVYTTDDGIEPSSSIDASSTATNPVPSQTSFPSRSHSDNNTAIIIMAVVIPVAVLILLVVALVVLYRRRRASANSSSVWGSGPRPIPVMSSYSTDDLSNLERRRYLMSGMTMDTMSQSGSSRTDGETDASLLGVHAPPTYESLWRDDVFRATGGGAIARPESRARSKR